MPPTRALPLLTLVLAAPAARAQQGASPAAPTAPAVAAASLASERAAVMAVVTGLFDAMRAGDSAKVRAAFHPEARLSTALVRNGQPTIVVDSLEKFVRAVGTPHADVWDERLGEPVVQVDGPLASVWVRYAFYAGPRFSHCGYDAFQLARATGGWRVIALADTRQRTGCAEQQAGTRP